MKDLPAEIPAESALAAGPVIHELPAPVVDPLTRINELEGQIKGLHAQLGKATTARDALAERLRRQEENAFNLVVSHHDGGALLVELGQKLTELAAAVKKYDKKGELAVKIQVKPFKKTALIFTPEVKLSAPRPEVPPAVFYAADDGKLSRHDPRQKEFDYTETSDGQGDFGDERD